MDNKNQVDDLVKMLDQMMQNGNGHVEVKTEDSTKQDKISVETLNSQACLKGAACQIPTLHEGLDRKE